MSVDRRILNEFIKITNDTNEKPKTKVLHGTIVSKNGKDFVKMDGSDIITPFRSTIRVKDKDRVRVDIQNHMVTVTGNITDPSASGNKVDDVEINMNEISLRVESTEGRVGEIEITSDSIISSVKDLDGKYTEIKQTVDGIDLTGMVTFNDLETEGKTVINGGNIKTNSLTATGTIGFANGALISTFPSQIPGMYGMEISAPQLTIAGNTAWSVGGGGDASFAKVTVDGSAKLQYSSAYSPYAGGTISGDNLVLGGCILMGASSSSMHLISSSGGKATLYANTYGYYDLPEITRSAEAISAFEIIDNTSVINQCIIPNTMPYNNSDIEPYLEVTEDGVNVNNSNCISLLWKAVQELKEENKLLKEQIGGIQNGK